MLEGIEILLQRIKDCPDEFFIETNVFSQTRSRWVSLVGSVMNSDIFTAEEVQAVKDAMKEAKRLKFNEQVLTTLAEGDNPTPVTLEAEVQTGLWGSHKAHSQLHLQNQQETLMREYEELQRQKAMNAYSNGAYSGAGQALNTAGGLGGAGQGLLSTIGKVFK